MFCRNADALTGRCYDFKQVLCALLTLTPNPSRIPFSTNSD